MPRGLLRAVPERGPLHAAPRAGVGLAADRAPPHRHLVHRRTARGGTPLPILPAPVPGRGAPLRPPGLRPRALVEPRGGQGRARAAGRPSRVLLLHAHALRVGPLRPLLRAAGERARPDRDAGPGRVAPALGPPDGRSRPPLRRHLVVHRRPHRPRLRARRRRDPSAGGRDPLPRGGGPGDYYLVVSALTPYKRVDLAVEAATRLGRRLVVVGTGAEERRLRALAGPTVQFLGWQDDAAVADLLAGCRALLFPRWRTSASLPSRPWLRGAR